MANFESGVASYVTGVAIIKVYFPVDKRGNAAINCKQCPYLSSNERICQLNKMPVAYPAQYVGDFCPLERKEE
jgi:hypothetical protein